MLILYIVIQLLLGTINCKKILTYKDYNSANPLIIDDRNGSLIAQTQNYCIALNIGDIFCSEIFVKIVSRSFPRGVPLLIPLQQVDIRMEPDKVPTLSIFLDSGPLFSQIDKF